MSTKNSLLWEKWRPKTFEDIILLPRIRKQFQDGISQHYIFHGHFGTGKTSLARILIGRYSKDAAFLEVNCSEETSIDYLREEISNFCKVVPMFETKSDVKYVFLDEFERVSANYQDAFKAFIEKYNNKGVRFILSTNHIDKIRGGIKSRIKMINFNCQNAEEEKYLKVEMFKRIKEKILPGEGRDIEKPNLVSIINKKFPDFRNIIVEIQDFLEVGEEAPGNNTASLKTKELLYSIVHGEGGYDETYHFLMSTFGDEKISEMLELMGRPFIQWTIEKGRDVDKLFECNHVVAEYAPKLETAADPIVLGMSAIGKFREILKRG